MDKVRERQKNYNFQLDILTTLQSFNLTTLQPYNLTTLQLGNLTTFQPYNLTSLQPENLKTYLSVVSGKNPGKKMFGSGGIVKQLNFDLKNVDQVFTR